MTTEELLIPRVEVVIDYPNSPFKIGDILMYDGGTYYIDCNQNVCGYKSDIEKYHSIFRKTRWHEKREDADLPIYLKDNTVGKIIIKVFKYNFEKPLTFISEANKYSGYRSTLQCYLPATEQEYINYITPKL